MNDSLKIRLSAARRRLALLPARRETARFREQASLVPPLPGGQRRIYFHHIPKAAGSSVLLAFLQACGGEQTDGREVADQLYRHPQGRLRVGGRGFVYFNHALLEDGDYFFGCSHFPSHGLQLPPETFTLSCLRDPLARVISLYRMNEDVLAADAGNGLAASLRRWWSCQTSWLGPGLRRPESFVDFAETLPRRFLLNQLYMFSCELDVQEGIAVASRCDHLMHLEEYADGMVNLGEKVGLKLPPAHTNRSVSEPELPEPDLMAVREMLAPEYEMVGALRRASGTATHHTQTVASPRTAEPSLSPNL